jgi:hypothetical protein
MTCRSEPNAAPSRSSLVADVEAARAALDRAERALADHDRPTVEYMGERYRMGASGKWIEIQLDGYWFRSYQTDILRALARLIGTPAVIDKDGQVWTGNQIDYARDTHPPVREAVVVEVET